MRWRWKSRRHARQDDKLWQVPSFAFVREPVQEPVGNWSVTGQLAPVSRIKYLVACRGGVVVHRILVGAGSVAMTWGS